MMVTDDFLLLKILSIYAIGLSSAKSQQPIASTYLKYILYYSP